MSGQPSQTRHDNPLGVTTAVVFTTAVDFAFSPPVGRRAVKKLNICLVPQEACAGAPLPQFSPVDSQP